MNVVFLLRSFNGRRHFYGFVAWYGSVSYSAVRFRTVCRAFRPVGECHSPTGHKFFDIGRRFTVRLGGVGFCAVRYPIARRIPSRMLRHPAGYFLGRAGQSLALCVCAAQHAEPGRI